nr:hypothetical protein [Bdellovibrionales bacterium]
WTMSRYGLTVGWNRSGSSTYEFEYTRGSLGFGYFGVDIGELAEQRFALNWRSYGRRNSFNFVTGLYYNELEIHIGSKYLTTVANVPEVDLLKLNTIGVSSGIGNRWQTKKGFVWGADWLVVHVPLTVTKEQNKFINETRDPDDRGDVDSGMKVLRRIPALAGLKVQLGFSF